MENLTSATIKMFLPTGAPQGLRTAEISNWSGVAIAAPRSEFKSFLKRPELARSGIYFLIGYDDDDGNVEAYIGEAETLRSRIKQHQGKEFWVQVIALTSKDENLTKGHIRYLERRCIELAKSVGKCKLTNSVETSARLPESDAADMEVFLERVIQLLPVLGTNILASITGAASGQRSKSRLQCKIKGLVAYGNRTPNGFVVYEGSQSVMKLRQSAKPAAKKMKSGLIDSGALVLAGTHYEFTRDVEFTSPSRAANVIRGGVSNGLTAWKDSKGRRLKDLDANV